MSNSRRVLLLDPSNGEILGESTLEVEAKKPVVMSLNFTVHIEQSPESKLWYAQVDGCPESNVVDEDRWLAIEYSLKLWMKTSPWLRLMGGK